MAVAVELTRMLTNICFAHALRNKQDGKCCCKCKMPATDAALKNLHGLSDSSVKLQLSLLHSIAFAITRKSASLCPAPAAESYGTLKFSPMCRHSILKSCSAIHSALDPLNITECRHPYPGFRYLLLSRCSLCLSARRVYLLIGNLR
jgi:hypothetical protein